MVCIVKEFPVTCNVSLYQGVYPATVFQGNSALIAADGMLHASMLGRP